MRRGELIKAAGAGGGIPDSPFMYHDFRPNTGVIHWPDIVFDHGDDWWINRTYVFNFLFQDHGTFFAGSGAGGNTLGGNQNYPVYPLNTKKWWFVYNHLAGTLGVGQFYNRIYSTTGEILVNKSPFNDRVRIAYRSAPGVYANLDLFPTGWPFITIDITISLDTDGTIEVWAGDAHGTATIYTNAFRNIHISQNNNYYQIYRWAFLYDELWQALGCSHGDSLDKIATLI